MALSLGLSGGGASVGLPASKTVAVSATATGTLYTIVRLLGGTSALSLISGTNANLTLSGANIQASAGIGAGSSQTAMVREAVSGSYLAVEYAVVLSGPPTVPASPTLSFTAGDSQLTVNLTDGSNGGSAITGHTLWLSTTNGFTPGAGSLYGPVSNGSVVTGLTNGTTYYGIAIATNDVGPSGNSSQASAAPASAATYKRFNPASLVRVTESGNSSAGYTYTASGVDGTFANRGICETSIALPANQEGYFGFIVGQDVGTSGQSVHIWAKDGSDIYDVQWQTGYGWVFTWPGGVYASLVAAPTAGQRMELRRETSGTELNFYCYTEGDSASPLGGFDAPTGSLTFGAFLIDAGYVTKLTASSNVV